MLMVEMLARMPDLRRRIQAEHLADSTGHCRDCQGAQWPCELYRLATEVGPALRPCHSTSWGTPPPRSRPGSVPEQANPAGRLTPGPAGRGAAGAGDPTLRGPAAGRPAAGRPVGGRPVGGAGRRAPGRWTSDRWTSSGWAPSGWAPAGGHPAGELAPLPSGVPSLPPARSTASAR